VLRAPARKVYPGDWQRAGGPRTEARRRLFARNQEPPMRDQPARPEPPDLLHVSLTVNGRAVHADIDPRTTLLDLLRERLRLTGTKKGCDHGQCGACTVHVEGRRINACLSLAAMNDGRRVTTIEGLGRPGALHPLQDAFVRHDGYQCGYCTAGQIMSAAALLDEPCGSGDQDVREMMSGNLCRCGAYANIVAAIQEVRGNAQDGRAVPDVRGEARAVHAHAPGER